MSANPSANGDEPALCRVCRTALPDGADRQRGLCPRCDALQALEDFSADQQQQAQRSAALRDQRRDRQRWRVVVMGATIALCLLIVAIRIPALRDALHTAERPMRHGTWATDTRTDTCIDRLWHVSARLQQGLALTPVPICPASGQPFEIRTSADDVIVRSPTPERYGLKEIRVSKRRPIPELIR